jgi:GntR family transcriptional regulator
MAQKAVVRQELRRWLAKARRAGLDEESIEALFLTTFRTSAGEEIA